MPPDSYDRWVTHIDGPPRTVAELASRDTRWTSPAPAGRVHVEATVTRGDGQRYRVQVGVAGDRAHVAIWGKTMLLDHVENIPEAKACRIAAHWVANLDAGLPWYLRPRRPLAIGDFYTDRCWSPDGARLHVLLFPEIADQLAATYGGVLDDWTHVLRPVPAAQIHLTLAWLPAPVSDRITAADRAVVQARLDTYVADLPPPSMLAGSIVEPPRVHPYGVRCAMRDPEPLVMYAHAATAALRDVFGHDSAADPHPEQHISLAYGLGGDVTDLPSALREQEPDPWPTLGRVRLAVIDADTFATPPAT